MTAPGPSSGVGTRIPVWDLPTRAFHWLLVATVAFCLLTGLVGPKDSIGWHMIAGYGVAGLLLFRGVWAAYGGEYSRLASFAYAPGQAIEHLRLLLRRRPAHYVGHNPAGAAMIAALLLTLGLLVATGFIVQGGVEKQGPFAAFLSYSLGMAVRQVHKLLGLGLLALIAAHLAGVLAGSFLFKERLVGAMVDGLKPAPLGTPMPRPARWRPALAWLALLALPLGVGLFLLSRLPALGMPEIPPSQAMLTECGACHQPFHPSLLPRAAWAGLMANLADHFGEDASLPAAKRDEIAAYLERYAAEAWDSKAARRFAVLAPDNPYSITATPGWQRIHRRIDPAVFRMHAVGSRANCAACHRDAGSGRFDPQAIAVPEGPSS